MSEDESLPDSETEKKSSASLPPYRHRPKLLHRTTGRRNNTNQANSM